MRRTVTALLFAEDPHRQHLEVGELRFRARVPQPTAERQYRKASSTSKDNRINAPSKPMVTF
jgi:hypothetical protein